jgi:hypothetical protein
LFATSIGVIRPPLRHEEQGGELAVSNSFLISTSSLIADGTLQHYIYAIRIGEARRKQHLALPLPSLLVMTSDDLGINMASVVSLHQSVLRKSDLIIEQPQQRLPIELVTLISSFLADTSSLRSLALLNQASHLVHEETISHLFSTTIYKCTPSWLHTVGYGIPKGWAHTR